MAPAARRYVGGFQAGRRHGEGALYLASGARYEGSWVEDRKHGSGVFVFEDGSVFDGAFIDDRPQAGVAGMLPHHTSAGQLQVWWRPVGPHQGQLACCPPCLTSELDAAQPGLQR